MSVDLKENRCPNRQVTCQDEQAMYQQIKRLKKVYAEGLNVGVENNASCKLQDKSTSVGGNGQFGLLFKMIVDRHEQNRKAITALMQQFIDMYREVGGYEPTSPTGSLALDTYHNRLSSQQAEAIELLLERLQDLTTDDLEEFKKMKLVELAVQLERRCEVASSELSEILNELRITTCVQFVQLVETGTTHPNLSADEAESSMAIDKYLLTELGELTVHVLANRLQRERQSEGCLSSECLQLLLSSLQLNCLKVICNSSSQTANLESALLEDPSAIVEEYHNFVLMRELEDQERNSLLVEYKQLVSRLSEYCMSKSNYSQYLEGEFRREDNIKSGVMDYPSFQGVLSKCRLLSPNEVATLFRGCLLVQKNILRSIVDRLDRVDYIALLNQILMRAPTKAKQQPIQIIRSEQEEVQRLQHKIDNTERIVNSLAQQKDELLYLLMTRTDELKRQQQTEFRKQLSELSEHETAMRQVKNQLIMQKLKYESEIKRLQTTVESQNRALQSYRAELEHIMNEINLRGR